jgi:hypothetical protein
MSRKRTALNTASRKTKSLTTRLTQDEHARLSSLLVGKKTVSELAREVLLRAAPPPMETRVIAEVLALRKVVVNVVSRLALKQPITEAWVQQLLETADREKVTLARTGLQENR